MIQSRFFRSRVLMVPLVTALVISTVLGAATAWTQGQPPGPVRAPALSEAERARQLQERDQLRAEVNKLAEAGKLDEVVAAELKILTIERSVLGELHDDVVASLQVMARLHELRDDWTAARKALTEVLAIRQRQPERKDWLIGDAKRALADLDRRVTLNPNQRQRLQEADRLSRYAVALDRQGNYAEGIASVRKAMEIRGGLLGENDTSYADSLNHLARLYHKLGEYAKAEPLHRHALDIRRRAGREPSRLCRQPEHLARLYHKMGDYAKAEPLFRQALEIRKRALGENHPDYAGSLNNLAMLYQDMADFAKAEPLSAKPWRSLSECRARTTPTMLSA